MKRERVQKEKGKRIVIRKRGISLVQEAGQSLVEFALVTLFVILPVTFGIIDGSILFYKWVALTNGAREGARTGAIYRSSRTSHGLKSELDQVDADRESVIRETVEGMVRPLVSLTCDYPPCLQVEYHPEDDPCVDYQGPTCRFYDIYRKGDRFTLTITHTHAPILGLLLGLSGIDLTASSAMRIEPGGVAPTPTPP